MKKIVLILLCFITLKSVFASSNNSVNKHVKVAVVALDTATTSEDEAKREKFKNNIIKCYGKVPGFTEAIDSAYKVIRKDFEEEGKTVECGRLMEIGRILGIK